MARPVFLAKLLPLVLVLLSPTHALSIQRRDVTVPANLPGTWTYKGCYSDDAGARTLNAAVMYDGQTMTDQKCINFCINAGYVYAGTEYSGECYCSNQILSTASVEADTDCNMGCSGDATQACGGPNRITIFWSGQAPPAPPAAPTGAAQVGDWASQGCYTDAVGSRTLVNNPGTAGGGGVMTVELCLQACQSGKFQYAGMEYGGECYCGNAFSNGGGPATSGCTMPCNGNANELCGGPNRLNVYSYTGTYPSDPAPPPNPPPPGWALQGCYTDDVNARALDTPVYGGADTMTLAQCISSCKSLGKAYAGVEYGGECYCGNAIVNGQGPAPGGTGCDKPCNGDSTQICGGANRLSVYTFAAGWYNIGCYTDVIGSRTLDNPQYGIDSMTNPLCQARCSSLGFSFAGTEYGGECYCDNSFKHGGGPAPDGNALCNKPCNGDATTICGGPNRLSVFQYISSPSDSTPTTTATTATTTPTNTATSAATDLPAGWAYGGCFVDGANGRILSNQQPDNSQMTVETCVAACVAAGYSVAGMEYSTQCFCGNAIIKGGALASSDDKCAMACGGNSGEKCGGPNLMSIYNTGTLVYKADPITQTTGLPGSWQYKGCITDVADARIFPYQIDLSTNNTAQNCLGLCQKFKYPSGGMEFGGQCFCGDTWDAAKGTLSPDTDCSSACTGNDTYVCGGPNRISLYQWSTTADPLAKWTYTSGAAAGEYEFLIGGPVVPLVATLGINGKVSFVEKKGTGPPNSTGAYELDLTLTNDYNAAWRAMHVKTDVFCSASLILPDKAGRQINIGGWANDATYGIRLYAPDGSPGQVSVNDWEEDVNVLSLLVGRWYPSAMVMTNGSILVVGGEEGSNGAPVPSVEILPRQPGVTEPLYCDWLERTDPYNLYPFLYVLPSGGIFVAYYNEARILNEVTLDTIKALPNPPAAVNNFLGGRTYPFEGSAVMMPQHAPYSDPVTIMLCGGSVPGPEIALDNCVSIQPDVSGADWVIERMPSQRVMSCIAPLPDGTYLIINGAQHGTAGFGRGSNPNFNALLYDPGQPVNQRFSLLANTTIQRLYHSEATLLQDGRVLISGSDPENNVQDPFADIEYRVEVFIPPYLKLGLTAPTYTIAQRDWAWGGSYQIQVTSLPSQDWSKVRISLIGASSSTHGANMGDRVFFPDFSCSGNTCTITAPPTKYICPPGWFQLFLLDGPMPSFSTFIRIGGDVGELGNWPQAPGFTSPGLGPID